jgi:hypothetical protein
MPTLAQGGRVSDTDAAVDGPTAATDRRTDDRRDGASGPATAETGRTEPEPTGFGTRGWALVGVVVLSVLVVPGVIYLFPALPADAGLPFLAAMLALPMLPAVLLGLTAVWSMTAAAGREKD